MTGSPEGTYSPALSVSLVRRLNTMKTAQHPHWILLAGLGLVMACTQAQAAMGPDLIQNGDFESSTGVDSSTFCDLANSGCTAPGWQGGTGSGSSRTLIVGVSSSDWSYPGRELGLGGYKPEYGDLIAGIQSQGTLSQTLTLEAGIYGLFWSDIGGKTPGVTEAFNVQFNGQAVSPLRMTSTRGQWTARNLAFTVEHRTTGTLTFQGLTSNAAAVVFFDNVKLMQLNYVAPVVTVPEPESLALALAGMAVVAGARRSRQGDRSSS
jgi:PEP-CTERM motif